MSLVNLRSFTPNDAPWIVAQHARLYARDEGFDDSFGPLVSSILEAFISDHDPLCERGWIAEEDGRPLGCIFCVKQDKSTAKLRLFLLLPEARGMGLGKLLLHTCTRFAEGVGYSGMRLWTHESHEAACALYRAQGWTLTASRPVHSFGQDLVEQSWEIAF